MQQTTFGHDSEYGLDLNGEIVSALDYLIPFESEDGAVFPDNMNAEMAITPVTKLSEFHRKTESLLSHTRDCGFTPVMEPVITYDDKFLKHPQAMISGCNPDYDGYTREENRAPDFTQLDGTRSLGAHIHIGDTSVDPFSLARWMDVFVTLPLLQHEKVSNRRSMYGGPACLRVKEYGTEYRSLSNVWLDKPDLREFVWEATHKALEQCKKADPDSIEDWWDIPAAIMEHDIELARKTLDRLYIYGVINV